jgi:hypothetical protein
MLTALLTFQDSNEQYHTPREGTSPVGNTPPAIPVPSDSKKTSATLAPPPPQKPAPKKGVDRIAEMQLARGEYNEITVEEDGNVEDYAQYCMNLLQVFNCLTFGSIFSHALMTSRQDDALLFITLRSDTAEQVPKVLQVVEQTKRIRYKTGEPKSSWKPPRLTSIPGVEEDEELHQYVLYDTTSKARKGPRRINLDSDTANKAKADYTPPDSLTVHLSKIPMPELQPKPSVHDKHTKETKKPDEKGKKKREDKKGWRR